MSTLKTTNLQNASASSPAFVLAADGSATAQLSSVNGGPISGARNRIINGDMRIDQRNAGAAVTANNDFAVDRFKINNVTDGAFSAQQDSSAPAGFVKSLKVTATTADASLAATQRLRIQYAVEGNDVTDLAFGTASAKTVTLSFWVRSSLTGTFGGSIQNDDGDRSYPFSYSISAANTWEQKSITITGDTTGTWLTTNGIGIRLNFGLGVGTDYSASAGSWTTVNAMSVTSAVSVIGTLNATWQITGVQLEAGSVATPFERRSYGQELSLCQRYYETASNVTTGMVAVGSTSRGAPHYFKVSKRASPTITYGGVNAFNSAAAALSSPTAADNAVTSEFVAWMISNFSTAAQGSANITASIEL